MAQPYKPVTHVPIGQSYAPKKPRRLAPIPGINPVQSAALSGITLQTQRPSKYPASAPLFKYPDGTTMPPRTRQLVSRQMEQNRPITINRYGMEPHTVRPGYDSLQGTGNQTYSGAPVPTGYRSTSPQERMGIANAAAAGEARPGEASSLYPAWPQQPSQIAGLPSQSIIPVTPTMAPMPQAQQAPAAQPPPDAALLRAQAEEQSRARAKRSNPGGAYAQAFKDFATGGANAAQWLNQPRTILPSLSTMGMESGKQPPPGQPPIRSAPVTPVVPSWPPGASAPTGGNLVGSAAPNPFSVVQSQQAPRASAGWATPSPMVGPQQQVLRPGDPNPPPQQQVIRPDTPAGIRQPLQANMDAYAQADLNRQNRVGFERTPPAPPVTQASQFTNPALRSQYGAMQDRPGQMVTLSDGSQVRSTGDMPTLYGASEAASASGWTGPQLATGLRSGAQRQADMAAQNEAEKQAAIARRKELMANSAGKAYGALPFEHEGFSKADAQRLAVAQAGEVSDSQWKKLYGDPDFLGAKRSDFQEGGAYNLTIPQQAMPQGVGSLGHAKDYYDKKFWDTRHENMKVAVKNIRETGDPGVGLSDLRKEAQAALGKYAGKTLSEEGKSEYGQLRGAMKNIENARLRGPLKARAYSQLMEKINASGLDDLVVKEPDQEESFNKNVRIDKEHGLAWTRTTKDGKDSWSSTPLPAQKTDWAKDMPDSYRRVAGQYKDAEAFQKAVDDRYKAEQEWVRDYNDFQREAPEDRRGEMMKPKTRSDILQGMVDEYNMMFGQTPAPAPAPAPNQGAYAPGATIAPIAPTPAPAYTAPTQSGTDMMSVTPPVPGAPAGSGTPAGNVYQKSQPIAPAGGLKLSLPPGYYYGPDGSIWEE